MRVGVGEGRGLGGVGGTSGGGPPEVAWGRLLKLPAGFVFEAMVTSAEGAEVVGCGSAAVLPAVGVVEVAALGGPGAVGEAAGGVSPHDVFGQRGRRSVVAATDVEDGAAGRVGDDAPPGGVGGERAGGGRVERTVARQFGGIVPQAEQGGGVDGDIDAHRRAGSGGVGE